ncbi:MAG: HU family DNA-binding protein [Spirochaetaceae bacterium]|jgi:nucleoid DNA-binding protein|nr:HU family DNA-binding protein [Spirochaetaceae bacterium]
MAARGDLIQALRAGTGLTMHEAALCVNVMVDWMADTLAQGKRIELRGLGTFEVKKIQEKKYPSLWSQKNIVPAHDKIIFRPSQKLRRLVWKREAK